MNEFTKSLIEYRLIEFIFVFGTAAVIGGGYFLFVLFRALKRRHRKRKEQR